MHLSPFVLRTGGPGFLPHSTSLRAGPLTLLLEQGEIRRVKLGEVEVLRRIYLAVRGSDWRTIPPVLADLRVEAGEEAFKAAYSLVHRQDEFDFTWKVEVEGDRNGRIRFLARGSAASAFATNRVGMCVLHPSGECAGRPVKWTGTDGSAKEGRFPDIISPHEPFKDIVRFSHQLGNGAWVDLAYEGEVFEMEDQRNWTDGSFKTYCPPAALPKPRKIEPGWETAQGVTLTLSGPAFSASPDPTAAAAPTAAKASSGAASVRLTLGSGTGRPLPALGHSLATHGRIPGSRDAARIRALAPAHLRCNFLLAEPGLEEAVARASEESALLGSPLEAALVVGEDVEGSLAAFAALWSKRGGRVVRWLVFHAKSDSTPVPVLDAAWRRLRDLAPAAGASFALGSKNDFVLLNRGRPALDREPAAAADLVYAMCPQVHAFDNRNLVESLDGQEWTLRTARALWPRTHPRVSTLSLKRSPFAASLKAGTPPPGEIWPRQADPRQVSLFAAGWTLGSLKRLSGQGAASATYYETTGPLGLMAGETCPPELRDFPGMDFRLDPLWVFPLYHVFADLAEFKGGETLELASSHPLRCDGIALTAGGRRAVLLANLEETPVRTRLEGLTGSGTGAVTLRRMNDASARLAVEDAEAFRARPGEPARVADGVLELELSPFEVVRVDLP